jgi:guanylate kinase
MIDTSNRRGLLVVISGPSGVGKTTIAHAVRDRVDAMFSISATTRPQTAQDRDGVDYTFVTDRRFREMIDEGALLEHAQVFGRHWYGTPCEPVERSLDEGRIVILEIDVQGAIQVRANAAGAHLIFILPPDEETLLQRLRSRGRDDEDAIARRFAEAKSEIKLAQESGAYDVFIVNENLDRAIDEACRTIDETRTARAGT